jgi:hypothetical protein
VGTIRIVKQAELSGEYVRSGILMVVGGTVVSNSFKVASRRDNYNRRVSGVDCVVKGLEAVTCVAQRTRNIIFVANL